MLGETADTVYTPWYMTYCSSAVEMFPWKGHIIPYLAKKVGNDIWYIW